MVTCTTPPFRAAVRLNSGVRARDRRMQLIYSTSDLDFANRLARDLNEQGVETHVSNSHSSRMPGFGASFTPGFVGVWVIHETDLPVAHEVLIAKGLIRPPDHQSPVFAPSKQGLLFLLAAVVVVVIGLLILGGP